MSMVGSTSVPVIPNLWSAHEPGVGTSATAGSKSDHTENGRVDTASIGSEVGQSHYSGGSKHDEPVTYPDPRVLERQKLQQAVARKQANQETQEIQALAQRDREVRAHEQAHMAAGGQYAGAASYQFERGPDGVSYAVSGEVPISTGKEATPQETLRKAQTVRRAALAPAEPSAQDRKVAAMASRLEAEARLELAQEQQALAEQAIAQQHDAEPSQNRAALTIESQPVERNRPYGAEGREIDPSFSKPREIDGTTAKANTVKTGSSPTQWSTFISINQPQNGGSFHQIA